jgi:hypothetical protein
MIDLLEKGDSDGRREVNHEILCAVIQSRVLDYPALGLVTQHNHLLTTIGKMCSCTFDLLWSVSRYVQ